MVPVEVNAGAPILATVEREVVAPVLVLVYDSVCGRIETGRDVIKQNTEPKPQPMGPYPGEDECMLDYARYPFIYCLFSKYKFFPSLFHLLL